jgi:predicted transcriptional regulator
MELTPGLQANLERIASQQDRHTKSLVHEALERLIGYDEWFLRQVEIGLAQADRGELLEDEKVVARMEALISPTQRQPGCKFAGPRPRLAILIILRTVFSNKPPKTPPA